jgi:hypothetical protein
LPTAAPEERLRPAPDTDWHQPDAELTAYPARARRHHHRRRFRWQGRKSRRRYVARKLPIFWARIDDASVIGVKP